MININLLLASLVTCTLMGNYRKLRNYKNYFLCLIGVSLILGIVLLFDDFSANQIFTKELLMPFVFLITFQIIRFVFLAIEKRELIIWLAGINDFDDEENEVKDISDIIFSFILVISIIAITVAL